MNKKRGLVRFILLALVLLLALPGFLQRIKAEKQNRGACLSLCYASLAEDFGEDEIGDCLFYAKQKGINTVSIALSEARSEKTLAFVSEFDTALIIDEYIKGFSYAELAEKLYNNNSLRHISVCTDSFADTPEYKELIDFISDKEINFVFMENEAQSANLGGFFEFPYTENGSYMRGYNTIHSANERIDTDRRFHQMLNSFKDRNTHFINIVPFDDSTADMRDNFNAAADVAELFMEELKSLGYPVNTADTDYSGYKGNVAFNMSLAAVLSVLLLHTIFELLIKKNYILTDALAVASAAIFIIFAYLFTGLSRLVYPLMLAASLACFGVTAVFICAKASRNRRFTSYALLMLSVLAACLSISGYFLSSVLSGVEYYMYFYTFRGVKLALFLPIIYTFIAYACVFGIRIPELKISVKSVLSMLMLAFIFAAVVFVYLMRSGNSAISDMEITFRDTIDTLMGIRPRTKEFLIGYPAFFLCLWYLKYARQNLFSIVFSIGVAILTGSVINSFCHVFTPCISIYQRSINGLILGLPLSVLALGVNIAFYRIFIKR